MTSTGSLRSRRWRHTRNDYTDAQDEAAPRASGRTQACVRIEPTVGAKPKKPTKRKSPERDPTETEFENWVKTRPWYPLFREAHPWYPDEKPSPAKKPKSEK